MYTGDSNAKEMNIHKKLYKKVEYVYGRGTSLTLPWI